MKKSLVIKKNSHVKKIILFFFYLLGVLYFFINNFQTIEKITQYKIYNNTVYSNPLINSMYMEYHNNKKFDLNNYNYYLI